MDIGGIIVACISAVVGLASVVALVIKSRGENATGAANAKTALDARIDARMTAQMETAWARIDELGTKLTQIEDKETRRSGAITRILRAIAKQWPADLPGPDLDPDDIAEIEETVPKQWIPSTGS